MQVLITTFDDRKKTKAKTFETEVQYFKFQ